MKGAHDLFESVLIDRGVAFEQLEEEGVYMVHAPGGDLTVSLHDISRIYARDEDPESVVRFVEEVLSTPKVPGWPEARSLVYFSAEASDHDFGDTIRRRVTEEVAQVMVVTDRQEGSITWLTPAAIAEWSATPEEVETAAGENLARLLEGRRPEVDEIDGMKLGMIPADSIFKASVIFAPTFKEFSTQEFEWPVLAVIPCRDFIYVLSEKDSALLDRMGGVVRREYRESGYPITTEVLRISDGGIEAIGAYPK